MTAANATQAKAAVSFGPTLSARPVWPRDARIIAASVMLPIPPMPRRCTPVAAGKSPNLPKPTERNAGSHG